MPLRKPNNDTNASCMLISTGDCSITDTRLGRGNFLRGYVKNFQSDRQFPYFQYEAVMSSSAEFVKLYVPFAAGDPLRFKSASKAIQVFCFRSAGQYNTGDDGATETQSMTGQYSLCGSTPTRADGSYLNRMPDGKPTIVTMLESWSNSA